MRPRTAVLLLAVLAVPTAARADAPTFTTTKLAGADSGTEPRIAVDQNDTRWVVTNKGGDAAVYSSADGGRSFKQTPSIFTQTLATIDVDIVTMDLGESLPRIFASELDEGGLNFPSGYSDDGGKTWTSSRGSTELADQDRQWFAVGPKDPITGKPHVYLLYHNFATGLAQHNMWVATSLDGGATFLPPVPIATPGSDAYTDLQCADSGGPSNITVNPRTGRIYAFFTTRAATVQGQDLGGCGSSALQPPLEFNIVNGTRVWVASSPDGTPGSWSDTLAVDDSNSGQVVSQQLAYGALDTKGGVYVAYPESPKPYPDLTGSAVKLVWQDPDASGNLDKAHWSKPVTLVPPTDGVDGADLVHLVAGDPGRVAVGYFKAQDGGPNNNPAPSWYTHVLQSLDVRSVDPHITDVNVAPDTPTYTWTASQMMGICAAAGPAQGVENGLTCNRSTDVWGIALDKACRVSIAWPTGHGGATGADAGTYVTTQTGGPSLCGDGTS